MVTGTGSWAQLGATNQGLHAPPRRDGGDACIARRAATRCRAGRGQRLERRRRTHSERTPDLARPDRRTKQTHRARREGPGAVQGPTVPPRRRCSSAWMPGRRSTTPSGNCSGSCSTSGSRERGIRRRARRCTELDERNWLAEAEAEYQRIPQRRGDIARTAVERTAVDHPVDGGEPQERIGVAHTWRHGVNWSSADCPRRWDRRHCRAELRQGI